MSERIYGYLWRLVGWLDNHRYQAPADVGAESIDWWRVLPFVALHIALFALYWVGWSPFAVLFAVALCMLSVCLQ